MPRPRVHGLDSYEDLPLDHPQRRRIQNRNAQRIYRRKKAGAGSSAQPDAVEQETRAPQDPIKPAGASADIHGLGRPDASGTSEAALDNVLPSLDDDLDLFLENRDSVLLEGMAQLENFIPARSEDSLDDLIAWQPEETEVGLGQPNDPNQDHALAPADGHVSWTTDQACQSSPSTARKDPVPVDLEHRSLAFAGHWQSPAHSFHGDAHSSLSNHGSESGTRQGSSISSNFTCSDMSTQSSPSAMGYSQRSNSLSQLPTKRPPATTSNFSSHASLESPMHADFRTVERPPRRKTMSHQRTPGSPLEESSDDEREGQGGRAGDWRHLIHTCAENGQLSTLRTLVKRGTPVGLRDTRGNTPLHWSAKAGFLDIVTYLLEHGADCNAINDAGWTAVHLASRGGHDQCLTALLQHNASPWARIRRDEHLSHKKRNANCKA